MFNALENVSKVAHQFLLFEKRNDNSKQQAENVKEEVDEFLVRFSKKYSLAFCVYQKFQTHIGYCHD